MFWRRARRTQASAQVESLVVLLGLACRMRAAPEAQMAPEPWDVADFAGLGHSIGWSATLAVFGP
jgi:hypothetical protein